MCSQNVGVCLLSERRWRERERARRKEKQEASRQHHTAAAGRDHCLLASRHHHIFTPTNPTTPTQPHPQTAQSLVSLPTSTPKLLGAGRAHFLDTPLEPARFFVLLAAHHPNVVKELEGRHEHTDTSLFPTAHLCMEMTGASVVGAEARRLFVLATDSPQAPTRCCANTALHAQTQDVNYNRILTFHPFSLATL